MKAKQLVISLYKNRGETPLECLERFRLENPQYKDEKMTYAGRLDPLAEGLLLVLTGEECKNKEKYLGLDKEYEVDILFGFATDTHDILGLITKHIDTQLRHGVIAENKMHEVLNSFIGKFSQKYPAFSSKTIKGESMFNLAKSGELKDEEIPEKDVEIKNIKLLKQYSILKEDLETYVKRSINLVNGDFRQEEIYKEWQLTLDNCEMNEFSAISIKVSCTSGTYMRTLADNIGKKVRIPALALNIKRTRVGKFNI